MKDLPAVQDNYYENEFFVYKELVIKRTDDKETKGLTKQEACEKVFGTHINNEGSNEEHVFMRYCKHNRMLLDEHKDMAYFIDKYKHLFPKFVSVSYKRLSKPRNCYLYVKGYLVKPSLYSFLSHKREDMYELFDDVDVKRERCYKIRKFKSIIKLAKNNFNFKNARRIHLADYEYYKIGMIDNTGQFVEKDFYIKNEKIHMDGEEYRFYSQSSDLWLYQNKLITTNSLDEFLNAMSIFISHVDENATETWSTYMTRKSEELMHLDLDKELKKLQKPLTR